MLPYAVFRYEFVENGRSLVWAYVTGKLLDVLTWCRSNKEKEVTFPVRNLVLRQSALLRYAAVNSDDELNINVRLIRCLLKWMSEDNSFLFFESLRFRSDTVRLQYVCNTTPRHTVPVKLWLPVSRLSVRFSSPSDA